MHLRWITAFIDRPADRFDETADFWAQVSGSTRSSQRGRDHEFATLLPTDGSDPHLRLQQTGTSSSGSHIDLHVDDVRAGVEECLGLGATVVTDYGGHAALASPGGALFCVVEHHGEAGRQKPTVLAAESGATLVDQISVDADPAGFDDEVDFWALATGWSPLAARAPEFVPLDRPRTMPLRVLLQRRDRASGPAGCHLDLACDDVVRAVAAHVSLGASVVSEHHYWTVMADPSGTVYCLTRRSPVTGNLLPKGE